MSAEVASERARVLNISDARPLLGNMPASTLRRLCASGEVAAQKIGRKWFVKVAYIDDVTGWVPQRDGAS